MKTISIIAEDMGGNSSNYMAISLIIVGVICVGFIGFVIFTKSKNKNSSNKIKSNTNC